MLLTLGDQKVNLSAHRGVLRQVGSFVFAIFRQQAIRGNGWLAYQFQVGSALCIAETSGWQPSNLSIRSVRHTQSFEVL
jgi:hypothetical protein